MHIGTVERSIRTVKERARYHCQNLPYKKMPKITIDHLLQLVISNLNAFPAKNGISRILSPAAIVMGTPKIECSRLQLEFGSYVQAHVSTPNKMKTRSIAAIALAPSTGRVGHHFMSLTIGRKILAFTWNELHIPD